MQSMDEPHSPPATNIEHPIDRHNPPLDTVPLIDQPFVIAYYADTADIPDCFDGPDETPLVDLAAPSADTVIRGQVRGFGTPRWKRAARRSGAVSRRSLLPGQA